MLELEEVTDAEFSAPFRLLSACKSLSRLVVSVSIVSNADASSDSVVCCDFHTSSAFWAAVTPELTAAVTSMPELEDPVAASRIALMSAAVEVLDEDASELTMDDELMRFPVPLLGAQ
jgi:hypothetical protein